MKFTILISLLVLNVGLLDAQNVELSVAEKLAHNFYYEAAQSHQKLAYNDFSLSHISTITSNNIPLCYVFNRIGKKGFIIISATSHSYPVLAYSFESLFNLMDQHPSIKNAIDKYKKEILYIIEEKVNSKGIYVKIWDKYTSDDFIKNIKSTSEITNISPLLITNWGQGCFYNDKCPIDYTGQCDRVLVGCVAVAMAQIMKFHNFPSSGTGSDNYYHPEYGDIIYNFSEHVFDWPNMPNELFINNDETALLLYLCGVSSHMNYGPHFSGAAPDRTRLSLINFFNYSDEALYLSKDMYGEDEWNTMLRNELDNSRPIFYEGYGSGGHAFNIDGYQGLDFFHFNWGWRGAFNGYFYLSSLTPGGNDYSNSQAAIIGIQPNLSSECSNSDQFSSPTGAINDGSGNTNYYNNADCNWLIQPEGAVEIKLKFNEFSTEENFDFVNVYDGSDSSSPLIGSFSGQNTPEELVSTGDALYIEFRTNENNTDQGWLAEYETSFCIEQRLLTSPQGVITDGSGLAHYLNNSDCQWLIQPEQATQISLSFSEFKTEENFDSLYIYDGSGIDAPLIGVFHGNTIPSSITSSGGSLLIHFKSDLAVTSNGWTATYDSDGIVNIPLANMSQELRIYPNPTKGLINIQIEDVEGVEVSDLTGEIVLKLKSNKAEQTLDLSSQSPGVYLLKITTNKETHIRKLVLE